MKKAKTAAWILLVVGLGVVTGFMVRFTWMLWQKYPPTDAASAWALWGAVGSVMAGVTGLWVGAVALRALRSLSLTRIEMEHRADRERKLVAIERLEEIATELIPLNSPILDAIAEHKIKPFLKATDQIQFNPDPKDITQARAWIDALPHGVHNQIVTFLNRWEAWCVYFTTGVADEEVAFEPIAPLLRSAVGQYYAMLLVKRAGPTSGTFPNLVKLFTLWSARMDAAQLARVHDDLAAQLDRKKTQLAKAQLPKSGLKFDM